MGLSSDLIQPDKQAYFQFRRAGEIADIHTQERQQIFGGGAFARKGERTDGQAPRCQARPSDETSRADPARYGSPVRPPSAGVVWADRSVVAEPTGAMARESCELMAVPACTDMPQQERFSRQKGTPYHAPRLLYLPSAAPPVSSWRFQSCWEGMRSARLNLLDAFSQAMISVSSTSASSS